MDVRVLYSTFRSKPLFEADKVSSWSLHDRIRRLYRKYQLDHIMGVL